MQNLLSVRKKLTLIWLIGSGILFILMVSKSINNTGYVSAIWAWYGSSILPGLGLILGLWTAVTRKGFTSENSVLSTSGTIAILLTIFYFLVLLLSLLGSSMASMSYPEYLQLTQNWLAVLQAPTIAFIAKIFTEDPSQS